MPKHLDELTIVINELSFDIITINETRLDESFNDRDVRISGYDIIRRDRNRHGGGVAIYIRNNIPYIQRHDLLVQDLETICVEIKKPKSKPFLISTWYRPPNSPIELFEKFENNLHLMENENKDLVITGDFNCDLLSTNKDARTKKLTDLLDKYQLQQHIQIPTRTTLNSKTLIDLMITKVEDTKTIDSGVIDLGISDHNLVYICRKVSIPKQPPKIVETRQFKNFNTAAFQHELHEIFKTYSFTAEPNTAWNEWKTIFLDVANTHAPIKTRRVKSAHSPWLTDQIKSLSYQRDDLKKKAIRLNSEYYHKAYKKCRNQVTKLIKKCKIEYFNAKLKDCKNSKECWQTINKLLNKHSKSTTVNKVEVNGIDITGDANIAQEFNDYFCSIGPTLASNIPITNTDPLSYVTPVSTSFEFHAITYDELIKVVKNLKTNKSPGLDNVSTKLVKEAGDSIIPSLNHLFNLSLSTGIFPEDWKVAKVTPIYKSGEKSDCGNYRPISVISTIAKIFEKIVYTQILDYLDENCIISPNQSGFRSHHSTETALLSLTNEWLINMDQGLINGVLFLDLKKAFDTVDHNILLSKLTAYGIKGTAHKWFQSYLRKRQQICKINKKMSDIRTITCGVPQGTNLGPLLFLLYINDLPNCLETTSATMFADDTSLSCNGLSSADIESKLNHDLEIIHTWLTANKLTLNRKKTEYMIIGSRQKLNSIGTNTTNISIAGEQIKRVESTKSLGIIIDEQLKWEEHNSKQCKTISARIGMLRRARDFVTQDVLIIMYNSLVFPHFTCCSTVWHGFRADHINKLYKLQKRAARVITGSSYDIRSTNIFETLNWRPIKDNLDERDLVMIFKALKGLVPDYLMQTINLNENGNYQLRSNNRNIYVPKPKTNFLKNSFPYRGAMSWNNLPNHIIDQALIEDVSVNCFKNVIKRMS